MIAAIVVAEVAFWVLLVGGLAVRYLVKAQRLSSVILAGVPLVDLGLVILVAVDVVRGAPPTAAHALASMYLGFTVAFGHSIIRRADAWFRYRFADGPRPTKPVKGSKEYSQSLWAEWFRLLFAAIIAAVCLLVMIALQGWFVPTSVGEAFGHPYWAALVILAIVVVAWFFFGPGSTKSGDSNKDREDRSGYDSSTR
ncbi:hypothetical protein [Sciscionella sediminilitoris]|uniref:hypothetical protein n=1 Tax=Sciscionella sediminilitoris TaxID=1445613 RepID=UPI00069158A9|nr:hypothetical protein [Sciscionella sp. SE31]